MRIGSSNAEIVNRSTVSTSATARASSSEVTMKDVQDVKIQQAQVQTRMETAKAQDESKEAISKEQLEKAVNTMNDFLEVQHKASKFVFHEGLDKYYVKLVDSETEEVIKEIPPERLLDAFYEMQKLTGMIVDEKI